MKLFHVFSKKSAPGQKIIEAFNTGHINGIETAQLYLSVTGFRDAADKLSELLDNSNNTKKE